MIDDHKFHKELSDIVIEFTVFISAGFMLFAIGISLWTFALGIMMDSGDKKGTIFTLFQQISHTQYADGTIFMVIGFLLLFTAIFRYRYRIKKLK